jgi:hypothetical protein
VGLRNNTDYVIANCVAVAGNAPVQYAFVAASDDVVIHISITVANSTQINVVLLGVAAASLSNIVIHISNVTNSYSTSQRNDSSSVLALDSWSRISGLVVAMDRITSVNSTVAILAIVNNSLMEDIIITMSDIVARTLFATTPVVLVDCLSPAVTRIINVTTALTSVTVEYLSTGSNLSLSPVFIMQINRAAIEHGTISVSNSSIASNATFSSLLVIALTNVSMMTTSVAIANILVDLVSPLNVTGSAATSIYAAGNRNSEIFRVDTCPTQNSSFVVSNLQVVVQYVNVTLVNVLSAAMNNSTITIVKSFVQSSNAMSIGLRLALMSFSSGSISFGTSTVVGAYETTIFTTDTVSMAQISLNISQTARVGNSKSTPWFGNLDAGSVAIFRTSNIAGGVFLFLDVTSTSNASFDAAFGFRATRMQINDTQVTVQRCSWQSSAAYGLLNAVVRNLTVVLTNSTFSSISFALFYVFNSRLASSTFSADDGTVTAVGTPIFRNYFPFVMSLNITEFNSIRFRATRANLSTSAASDGGNTP